MQLNPTNMKQILHLISVKNITFKSSYNWFKIGILGLLWPPTAQLDYHVVGGGDPLYRGGTLLWSLLRPGLKLSPHFFTQCISCIYAKSTKKNWVPVLILTPQQEHLSRGIIIAQIEKNTNWEMHRLRIAQIEKSTNWKSHRLRKTLIENRTDWEKH